MESDLQRRVIGVVHQLHGDLGQLVSDDVALVVGRAEDVGLLLRRDGVLLGRVQGPEAVRAVGRRRVRELEVVCGRGGARQRGPGPAPAAATTDTHPRTA